MIKLEKSTIEKLESALNQSGPVKITFEKNVKGTVTMEITEKNLLNIENR